MTFFFSILGNEGHFKEKSILLLLKEGITMITGSSFAKVAFLAVDEQLLLILLHLLYPVLQSYSVQYVKMCILHLVAIPPQWHC